MSAMTPDYDISAGGTSLRARLAGRAVSISVTDARGAESDTASFQIEAGGRDVAIPPTGQVIAVSLGYRETGLVPMGLFTVDEVTVEGMPLLLTVSAKAADMKKTLKEQKTRSFEKKTLGAIIGQIAGEHGLAAAVSADLAARLIPWAGQSEESDLHFVTRLARAHGAVAAPKNGRLVFAPKGQGRSATGLPMPGLVITPAMCAGFSFTLADRPKVEGAEAHWWDRAGAKRTPEKTGGGGGEGIHRLRHAFATREEAGWAAAGAARDLKAGAKGFSAELPGDPRLAAEMRIEARGFYPGADGAFTITSVTHEMGQGFTTSIECEAAA